VLMVVVAPIVAIMHRSVPEWVLPVSFAIYITSVCLGINVKTWPTHGQWFFNPLCWQLIFVLGFTMSREYGPARWVRNNVRTLRIVAVPLLIVIFCMGWFNLWWDPTKLPEPRLLFLLGKTFVTPIRLIQFLALILVMSMAFPYIVRYVPGLVAFFSALGRNSLPVFCVGSLLSLAGQIVRSALGTGFILDTFLVGSGVLMLWVVAWLAEWRSRTGAKA
ncbi:MAG: OpgC domain-containing protein, partial [Hyphomicrobiaceae bacterium]